MFLYFLFAFIFGFFPADFLAFVVLNKKVFHQHVCLLFNILFFSSPNLINRLIFFLSLIIVTLFFLDFPFPLMAWCWLVWIACFLIFCFFTFILIIMLYFLCKFILIYFFLFIFPLSIFRFRFYIILFIFHSVDFLIRSSFLFLILITHVLLFIILINQDNY